MRKLSNIVLNGVFFLTVIIIAFSIATIALTKKVNEYALQNNQQLKGTVMKQNIPVLSFSQGIVKKIHVRVGEEVKKNDLLIEIDNPVLRGKIDALQKYPDNISAQTEAQVAIQELKGLQIFSPVNGVVADIGVSEGSPIESLSKVMTIYSNENIQLLSNLTNEEYTAVQQVREAKAYSPRLNQNFALQPDILRPNEKEGLFGDKKVGLYFTFKDKNEASSLLDNEDLDIQIATSQEKINKPIDFFVNFWNNLLSNGKRK